MGNENLKPIEKLTPFTKMIMTIGTLPSSFYASMSYYESMVWLYEYLKNEVIPTVNNNGEAVEELQTAFTTLQNWIEHYFDNLDLQQEVNTKLDEMAEDGSLTNLIKAYVDPIYQAYESEMNSAFDGLSSTTANRLLAQDVDIANFKGTVNNQIAQIDNKVDNATSGSPKGVYSTLSALTSADPDHDYIYVVTEDGKWYYYNTTTSSWTAGGTYQAASFTLDPTFESTTLPASAKDTGEYLNKIIKPINLFNPNDEDVVIGKYIQLIDAELGNLTDNNSAFTTGYINVNEGDKLYIPFWYGNYGNNPYIVGYDSSDNPQKLTLTLDANNIGSITIPSGIVSFRTSYTLANFSTYMIIKAFNDNGYPNSYIPYGTNLNHIVKENETSFISNINYNLFNPEDPDIVEGKRINDNTLEDVTPGGVSGYIPVEYNQVYIFPAPYKTYYGSSNTGYKVSCYDGNKNYAGVLYGDVTTYTNDGLIKVTITNARYKYIRVNFIIDNKSYYNYTGRETYTTFMVWKGTTYPAGFYPYGKTYNITNINNDIKASNKLLYKSIIGLGDSICASYSDDKYKGWIGRIANNNNMIWINTAIGGGTICDYEEGRHCIAKANMRYMSNPDYILFEGGTNDADLIGDATGSVKPAKFGTFSMTNWGTDVAESYYGFDVTTFCGAFEYLIKRLLLNYPNSKIGYIIPMKMGVANNYTPEVNNRAYYFDTAKKICEKWGVPYIDLWNTSPMNPRLPIFYTQDNPNNFYQDGQHPTAKGYDYLNNAIEEFTRRL